MDVGEVDLVEKCEQGIAVQTSSVPSFMREDSMRRIMVAVVAVLCLAGFSAVSFADEMGKGKEGMKGEMKGDMRKTHDDMGDMKHDKDQMQGDTKKQMKGDSDKMKGEVEKKDDMGKMKGK
jgi:hypothetical protein